MFGFGVFELLMIALVIGLPLGLCVMLARLKGRNGAWGLLSLVNIGVGFLVVGLIEAEPDRATPKVRKWSIAAIVVGCAFLIIKWVGSMLHTLGEEGEPVIVALALTLFLLVVILGSSLFLCYKLARLKGLRGPWALLSCIYPGVAFLTIGLMKSAPDHDTPKSKKLSIAAIVVGGVLVALQLIMYLLEKIQGM